MDADELLPFTATLDRAEVAIRLGPTWPVTGDCRNGVLDRREEATRRISEIDEELAALVAERRAAVERVRRCNLALVGTGEIRDRHNDELLQRLAWRARIPIVDPMPELPADPPAACSTDELRESAVSVLEALRTPVTLAEIERLLRLGGVVPPGRASKTLSDALRSACRAGRVTRVGRGRYQAPGG